MFNINDGVNNCVIFRGAVPKVDGLGEAYALLQTERHKLHMGVEISSSLKKRIKHIEGVYDNLTGYAPRCSSGSIVSHYGLDDRAIEVRSLAEAKDFSCSLCVQTGSEAHPAPCPMGTGSPFSGANYQPGRDADHSPPPSVEVENE
jgi:hypothetical protein